jgi:hypothetical protein
MYMPWLTLVQPEHPPCLPCDWFIFISSGSEKSRACSFCGPCATAPFIPCAGIYDASGSKRFYVGVARYESASTQTFNSDKAELVMAVSTTSDPTDGELSQLLFSKHCVVFLHTNAVRMSRWSHVRMCPYAGPSLTAEHLHPRSHYRVAQKVQDHRSTFRLG